MMLPPSDAGSEALFEPIAGDEAACAVKLPIFEGPLDLLLLLIRHNELDITDLPVALIAEQYLAYLKLMRELQLDVVAEYLVMAATLAWIKSRMLLPAEQDASEEEGPDPRAELVARLLEYQRYKEAAADLANRPRLDRDVFAGSIPHPEPEADTAQEIAVELVDLVRAFRRALQRTRPGSAWVHEVVPEAVTVGERLEAVMARLAESDTLELSELFQTPEGIRGTPLWIVATFLAILELTRLTAVHLYQGIGSQGQPEGPIRLRRTALAGNDRWREAVPALT